VSGFRLRASKLPPYPPKNGEGGLRGGGKGTLPLVCFFRPSGMSVAGGGGRGGGV